MKRLEVTGQDEITSRNFDRSHRLPYSKYACTCDTPLEKVVVTCNFVLKIAMCIVLKEESKNMWEGLAVYAT